jgi:hypothetical protein
MTEPTNQQSNFEGSKKEPLGCSFHVHNGQGMKSKSGKLLISVLSGLFVLTGMGMASYGLPLLIEARQSASWPAVEDRITHSELVDVYRDSDDTDRRQRSYEPNIRYSYHIDGVAYQGTRFSYNWRLTKNNRSQAHRFTWRYPLKTEVQVYYNPTDPQTSTLEPGFGKATFMWLVGGLTFATFGVSLFLITFPSTSRKPQTIGCSGFLLFIVLLAFAIWVAV